jgi:hypothetical protein
MMSWEKENKGKNIQQNFCFRISYKTGSNKRRPSFKDASFYKCETLTNKIIDI